MTRQLKIRLEALRGALAAANAHFAAVETILGRLTLPDLTVPLRPPDEVFELVMGIVCEQYRLNRMQILGRCRLASLVRPRVIAVCLVHHYSRASSSVIGTWFNRDHGSILYSINACVNRQETEPEFRAEYLAAEARLKARLAAESGVEA